MDNCSGLGVKGVSGAAFGDLILLHIRFDLFGEPGIFSKCCLLIRGEALVRIM